MEVGAKIKEYIDNRGISQTFVSARSGIPSAKLNLSLNCKRKLSLAEYESICGVLGVPVDTFLEPRPPKST